MNKKTTQEMWTILKVCFHYIFLINVTFIFLDAYNVKLSDYKNIIIDYKSWYQNFFNKIVSLTNEDSWMSQKTVKLTLEKNILGKSFSTFVAAINNKETTNLSDKIRRIIWHLKI